MSYQVLARKWRPQTFSELVGQQHVVDAITNALENNKLHHAYLFTGTRGVGKTTIARIFSKSLNCEEGQSANPCGKCDTCLDISEGRFVDLLEIDAASRTKVEDTRELLDNVQYKPTRGKFKVYLIDEVHMLSKHSFNALLKTLEEPPPHVKFLLATTDPQKLPVTILSRCLQFSLKALSREQIQTQLAHILDQEKIAFEAPALSQIARAAAGSMRDALSLTDQAIAQGNNQVHLNTVVNMLGLLDKNQVLKLAKFICERDVSHAMAQLDEICADAPDYSQVLSQLLALFHQIALTQIVPDICKLDTNAAKPIYTLSKSISAEHIQLLYQIGLNGKRDLPFAPDAFTGLQMTIMRMLAFSPAQAVPLDVQTLVKELSKDEASNTTYIKETEALSSHHAEKVLSTEPDKSKLATEAQTDVSALSFDDELASDLQQQALEQDVNVHEDIREDTEGHSHESNAPNLSPEAALSEHDDKPGSRPQDPQTLLVDAQDSDLQGAAPHNEGPQNEDPISALQDLFDLEEDLKSYSEKDEGESQAKKSEGDISEAADAPSLPSQAIEASFDNSFLKQAETPTHTQNNLEREKERSVVDADSTFEAASKNEQESASDIEIEEETDVRTATDESPKKTEPVAANGGELTEQLKPYLDTGEKLTSAAQIDRWSQFVDSLDVRGLARQLLIHGRSPGIKDNVMRLEINESHHHLNEQSSIDSIKEALKQQYQRDIDVQVEYAEVSNSPYEIQQQIDAMRIAHAKNVINNDSSIQELIKAFDAKVVPESIESR